MKYESMGASDMPFRQKRELYRKIEKDYENIVKEFAVYLNGFKKAARKQRIEKEPLYRESSLINFLPDLKIKQ